MLRWLVPTLGCVIYLLYIVISQMLFTLFRAEATEMTLTLALLSIGGSFFSTIIANISLKDKIVERAIQTK